MWAIEHLHVQCMQILCTHPLSYVEKHRSTWWSSWSRSCSRSCSHSCSCKGCGAVFTWATSPSRCWFQISFPDSEAFDFWSNCNCVYYVYFILQVVRTPDTSDATNSALFDFSEKLGKTPVQAKVNQYNYIKLNWDENHVQHGNLLVSITVKQLSWSYF